MNKRKIVFLGFLGAVFLLIGFYYNNSSFQYFGFGTLFAGLLYYTLFRNHKEIMSLVLGLLILHSGVLLIIERTSNPRLLGLLVFTTGVMVVLNSGFADYMKKRK
ncbi:MAG: hypothetical protein FIB08_04785 [Candidatus Methanoperedens sp.]|nr:hypothetical protein [Candidatus Methanoperedens sp.]